MRALDLSLQGRMSLGQTDAGKIFIPKIGILYPAFPAVKIINSKEAVTFKRRKPERTKKKKP